MCLTLRSSALGKRVGLLIVLCVGLGVLFASIDEPLRRYAERAFNERVDGYTLTIQALRFHPIGLSVDFEHVRLVQREHPDPPIALIDRWHAGIHWRALLHGSLVSDHRVERPVMHITRMQAKAEAGDDTPLKDRGWQDAVLAVYPFKIDVVTIVDADISYRDSPRSTPLHLDHVTVHARNIRNVQFGDSTYPSQLHLDGRAFDSGRITMDGAANFLSEPHFGVNVEAILERIPLDALTPLTGRVNVQLTHGLLSATGRIEYSPVIKQARLRELMLEDLHVDYVHSARTKEAEKKVGEAAVRTAEKLSNHAEWLLRIDHATLLNSEIGFVNEATTPHYRIFLSDANIGLDNISNQLIDGTAYVKATGKFMGSGLTQVSGTFRPETDSPDFSLQVRMVKTNMQSLNDVLRAYGDFDVVQGAFSFFTELTVKNGAVDGYVKPLFKDVDVYDTEQDRDKKLAQKIYEGVVGGAVTVLENRPRHEVATLAEVSGPPTNPRMSTWQVVAKLIQNAFFQAILPGLRKDLKER